MMNQGRIRQMSDIGSKLVVVSGPAGVGKDTVVAKLLEIHDCFSLSVSATTRAPRGTEQHGINYYYFSQEEFLSKIENNEFIEYAKYGANYYGTLRSDVEERIRNGKTVILVIEVKGAANIKKIYPDSLSIFVMPPSEEILESRLRGRQTECEADIQKRLAIAQNEMQERVNYDFIIVNDELEKAVGDAYEIIKNHTK